MSSWRPSGWKEPALAAAVAGNLFWLLLWASARSAPRPLEVKLPPRVIVTNVLRPIRTNLVLVTNLPPPSLRWADLESTNWQEYMANLRAVGMPEPLVRAVIAKEIDMWLIRRRAKLFKDRLKKWWLTDEDPELGDSETAWLQTMEEATQLREQLLGAAGSDPWRREAVLSVLELDGPALGALPPEQKEAAVEAIAKAFDRDGERFLDDPSAFLTLKKELASILPPDAVEEFSLRYSPAARELRTQFRGFHFSPEQFRALYRRVEAMAAKGGDQYDLSYDLSRPEAQVALLKEVAGPKAAEAWGQEHDPAYRSAEELQTPVEQVRKLAEIERAVAEEKQRLAETGELSAEEMARRLAEIERQRLEAAREVLGEEAFRRWAAKRMEEERTWGSLLFP